MVSVPMAMQVSLPQPAGDQKTFISAFGGINRSVSAGPSPSPLQPIMMMRSSVVNDRVLATKDSRVERLSTATKTTVRWWTSCSWRRSPACPRRPKGNSR